MSLAPRDQALLDLLTALSARKYRFVTPTPMTHARGIMRRNTARDLRDVFGWSLPFAERDIDAEIVALAKSAEIIPRQGDLLASTLRVSSLDDLLFLHSAFPTTARDSVFFGPDSYRYATFIARTVTGDAKRIADIGAGAGVGAIVATRLNPGAVATMTDINPAALRLALINASHAGVRANMVETNALDTIDGDFDLIIANPPYIIDDDKRTYRDGGALYGGQVSLDWTSAALEKLAPKGSLLLYTGAAFVAGESPLLREAEDLARATACDFTAEEIDPDVFGEELGREAYAGVERIAAVGVTITKR